MLLEFLLPTLGVLVSNISEVLHYPQCVEESSGSIRFVCYWWGKVILRAICASDTREPVVEAPNATGSAIGTRICRESRHFPLQIQQDLT
jgi:hypothetical protein